ncbi:hypothetical protein E1A91_A07G066600v1 [Gossypium mustelinum]|uniref:BSD domain-containing protein n=2 Tax=Gossypium TaxID=3633 RepID=A0A5D2YKS3_GOSMU|nr:hypothetical protein ES288_A07G068500v1 [Gossypium darwinii]TYJ25691.1 hypothetical protein E1A91_A07G066600v1 [Gossypium mustelinum]
MDIWNKARNFAEDAARRSSELSIGSAKLGDIVTEAMKRSKEIAAEASKRAEEIKAEAAKQAELIKSSIAEGVAPPQNTERMVEQEKELESFGINEELRDFVKGITLSTFQDFPLPGKIITSLSFVWMLRKKDDSPMSDVPTISNVRQDLTEWQEKHAKLVLSTVKEISKLRFELCPRVMRERKFWRIYFLLVNSHVAPYEKWYMEEIERKTAEKIRDKKIKESSNIEMTTQQQAKESKQHNKTSASFVEQDLDVFLLGGDSDECPDDGDEGFDDFGSDDEKVKS